MINSNEETDVTSEDLRRYILSENVRLHRDLAQHYDSIHPHMRNAFEQNMQRGDIAFMIDSVKMHRASPRVLELGCGTGNLTMLFLAQGCVVTGVDLSAEMVEVLRAKLAVARIPQERIGLYITDVDTFLRENAASEYDIVAMSSVAHHLPDYVATLGVLGERIATGGFLYLVHEPVHKEELATSYRWARRLASVLPRGLGRISYTWHKQIRSGNQEWLRQDTTFVDYHEHRSGVSLVQITERLRALGFTIVSHEHYNSNRSSLGSYIDNRLLGGLRNEQFQRTYFRVILQRG